MEELDCWTDANVIALAFNATQDDWEPAVAAIKQAIRAKVLESYRNGQAAGGVAKSRPSSFRPRRQSSK